MHTGWKPRVVTQAAPIFENGQIGKCMPHNAVNGRKKLELKVQRKGAQGTENGPPSETMTRSPDHGKLGTWRGYQPGHSDNLQDGMHCGKRTCFGLLDLFWAASRENSKTSKSPRKKTTWRGRTKVGKMQKKRAKSFLTSKKNRNVEKPCCHGLLVLVMPAEHPWDGFP